MKPSQKIAVLAVAGLTACIIITSVFAQEAPSENATTRAKLILGSQESIEITKQELLSLKADRKELDDKITNKEKVWAGINASMNADIAAIEAEGWTWDFEHKKLIPFAGSPKA
jgi:hypothetical protein